MSTTGICSVKTNDKTDIDCGDTTSEFTIAPSLTLITKDVDSADYFLSYYQSIMGTFAQPSGNNGDDAPVLPTIGGLYVEPIGDNCETVHKTGGLDNFWRSARYLNTSDASYLSTSQSCPIRDIQTTSTITFSFGTHGLGSVNEKNCSTASFDAKSISNRLAYTSGGFCSQIQASGISFGSQQQFLAKDCISDSYGGGAWAITLLNCYSTGQKSSVQSAMAYRALAYNDSSTNNYVQPIINQSDSSKYIVVEDDDFKVKCPDIIIYRPSSTGNNDDTTKVDDSKIGGGIYDDQGTLTPFWSSYKIDNLPKPSEAPQFTSSWTDFQEIIKANTDTGAIFVPAGLYYIDKPTTITKHVLGIGMPVILLKAPITFKDVQIYSLIFDVFNTFNSDVITFEGSVKSFDLSVRCGGLADTTNYLLAQDEGKRPDGLNKDSAMLPPNSVKISPGFAAIRVSGDDCYMENTWIWRADHYYNATRFKDNSQNSADHGIIIDGDRFRAACLQVEHFDRENVIWNGNDGKLVMFQNEMPYYGDSFNTPVLVINGKGFQGWSIGIYCYFANSPVIVDHTIRITKNASDAKIYNFFNIWLGGSNADSKISNGLYDENSCSYYGSGASAEVAVPKLESFGVRKQLSSCIPNWDGSSSPSPSSPPSKKKSKAWIWIMLIIFAVIVLGVILFFALKKHD